MPPVGFVPYVPVHHSQPPSPRAEELGQRLTEVLQQFEVKYPDLTRLEMRQALGIALSRAGREDVENRARPVAIALVVAAVAGVLAAGLATGRGGAGSPMLAVMLAILGVLLVMVLLARLRGR